MPSGTSTQRVMAEQGAAIDESLRRFIGYRLKRAYSTIRSDLLERLEPLGLRITTFSALALITDNPGLRQSELAAALDIKRSNMVAIVDDLEGSGWVSRKAFPKDRRAFALYPTSSGRKMCKKAVGVVATHDAQVLEVLNDDELDYLSRLLDKIEAPAEAS